jgi:hypothetical protein
MRFSTRLVALAFFAAAPAYAQSTAQSLAPTNFVVPTPTNVTTDSARVSNDSVTASLIAPVVAAPADIAEPVVVASGATLTGLRAGVHTRETPRAGITAAPSNANLGQARAMMIVGVGGLIAGAIIGGTPGTIIMVGGAVVGLLGLYDFLQ